MNASVKENTVLGINLIKHFHEETIEACQLLPDLAISAGWRRRQCWGKRCVVIGEDRKPD